MITDRLKQRLQRSKYPAVSAKQPLEATSDTTAIDTGHATTINTTTATTTATIATTITTAAISNTRKHSDDSETENSHPIPRARTYTILHHNAKGADNHHNDDDDDATLSKTRALLARINNDFATPTYQSNHAPNSSHITTPHYESNHASNSYAIVAPTYEPTNAPSVRPYTPPATFTDSDDTLIDYNPSRDASSSRTNDSNVKLTPRRIVDLNDSYNILTQNYDTIIDDDYDYETLYDTVNPAAVTTTTTANPVAVTTDTDTLEDCGENNYNECGASIDNDDGPNINNDSRMNINGHDGSGDFAPANRNVVSFGRKSTPDEIDDVITSESLDVDTLNSDRLASDSGGGGGDTTDDDQWMEHDVEPRSLNNQSSVLKCFQRSSSTSSLDDIVKLNESYDVLPVVRQGGDIDPVANVNNG